MSNFAALFLLAYFGCIYRTFVVDICWGIYMYQLEYFLFPPNRWWYGDLPNLRWSFTISISVLFAFIIKKSKYAKNKLSDVPQGKWFILHTVWFILVSNWAVWPLMHSMFLEKFIKLALFLFIVYKTIDTPKRFDGMMWAFMIGNFYVAKETKDRGRDMFGRVEGTGPSDTGGDGNNTAALLVSAVPLLIYYVVKNKGRKRFFLLVLLAFTVNGVVLINSRGSFLGLVASCAYLGYYVLSDRAVTMKQRFQVIGLVILGLCAFLYLADDTFWERMNTLKESGDEKAGGGRKVFWMLAVDLANKHPLGVGSWGFQYLSPQFVPPELLSRASHAGEVQRRAVHSLYFQCLAERGYPGMFFFINLILSNFLLMRKVRRHLRKKGELSIYFQGIALESGFIAFLIASIFLNRLYAEILYWLMTAIACFGNIYLIKNYDSQTKK